MKVLIGVDVDPILPAILKQRPHGDIWTPLDLLPQLQETMGPAFPRMTWLIRVDQSVHFATGDFLSGYLTRRGMWDGLQASGHELGWHMHYLSLQAGTMAFDPDPDWLPEAFARLSECYPVRAVRTGWDYGSNAVFRRWREFGIRIDFSALPGGLVFAQAGTAPLMVDWRRCPERPYYPSEADYQSPSASADDLVEIPITQFPSGPLRAVRRLAWRVLHGYLDLRGVGRCTRMLTQPWRGLPDANDFGVWAFFYHPEDLANGGAANLKRNVQLLREAGAEFVTASEVEKHLRDSYAAQMRAASTNLQAARA